jgi:hypothetical protein
MFGEAMENDTTTPLVIGFRERELTKKPSARVLRSIQADGGRCNYFQSTAKLLPIPK